MKFLQVEVTLSEAILNKPNPLRKSEASKKAWLAKLPLTPVAYTLTNKSGDKSEVDDWTREIKSVREIVKTTDGRVYFRVTLTMPNYINSNYENDFLMFALGEIGRLNQVYDGKVLNYKFDGNVSIIDAVSDSVTEKKQNYIDQPVNQLKGGLEEMKKFAIENKGLIIGGLTAVAVIVAIAVIKK